MSIGAIGLNPTQVDSSSCFAKGVRGAVEDQTSGVKEYMYVQFPASTALAAGDAVLIDGAGQAYALNTTTTTPGDASAARRVGIVQATVASSASAQYGWVLIYGPCTLNVAASCVRATVLNSTGTSGRLDDDATAGSEVVDGLTLTTTATTAGVYAAQANYPYVGRTL